MLPKERGEETAHAAALLFRLSAIGLFSLVAAPITRSAVAVSRSSGHCDIADLVMPRAIAKSNCLVPKMAIASVLVITNPLL
jgi:hypothetical protein